MVPGSATRLSQNIVSSLMVKRRQKKLEMILKAVPSLLRNILTRQPFLIDANGLQPPSGAAIECCKYSQLSGHSRYAQNLQMNS